MKIAFAIIVAGLCCLMARAEDWTVNGKDYHNVQVGKVDTDRVHITYDGGVGAIALSELSPELQKKFNYDPKKAKEASEQRSQHDAQIDAERRPALQEMADEKAQRQEYDAEVARIEEINRKNREYNARGGAFYAQIYPIPEFKKREVIDPSKPQDTSCRVLQVLSDGFITSNFISKFGAYDLAFIKCDTTGMIDGQQWHGQMIPFNTYRYVNTSGNTSTIACFTTDLSQTPSKPAPSNYVFPRAPVSSSMSVGGGN